MTVSHLHTFAQKNPSGENMSRLMQRLPRSFKPTGGAGGGSAPFLGAALAATPFFRQWDYSDSYSTVADPSTLPTGVPFSISYASTGLWVAIAHTNASSVNVTVYDPNDLAASPIQLLSGNGSANCVRFSPDGTMLAVWTRISGAELVVYNTSSWGVIATRAVTGALAAAQSPDCIAWAPDSSELAIALKNSPFFTRFDSATFTEDTVLPTPINARGLSVGYSGDGKFIVVGKDTAPQAVVLDRNDSLNTIVGAFDTIPSAGVNATQFFSDSSKLMMQFNQRFKLYSVVGSDFTELASNLFLGGCLEAAIKPDDLIVGMAGSSSPFVVGIDVTETDPFIYAAEPSDTQSAKAVAWGPE